MAWKLLIDIGLAAIDLGLLSRHAFAEAMIEIGTTEGEGGRDIWLSPGRLNEAELSRCEKVVAEGGVKAAAQTGPRYVRAGLLGTGGTANVEECVDERLARRVALKWVRDDIDDRAAMERMLRREATVTGMLEHPGIVPVYDAGEDPTRGPYYVMRIVGRQSMADVLDRLQVRDGDALLSWSLSKLLRAFVQVCNAVEFAHSHGVVHRDLKPANILLGSLGEVLVVDWGVAYRAGDGPTTPAGTPGYLSPDMLDATRLPIPAGDVFALGAVLYEILALEPPFHHQSLDDLFAAVSDPKKGYQYVKPSESDTIWQVSEELDEICGKALSLDPSARYVSAGPLGAAIEAYLEGTKERERKQQRAEELCNAAEDLYESYADLASSRAKRIEEVLQLRENVTPWAPESEKQAFWDAEDSFRVMENLALRTMQNVVSTYEQALEEVPEHPRARRGLVKLYSTELKRAEDRRDSFERLYFLERVQHYSDDTASARERDSVLSIDTGGVRCRVHFERLEEQGRRLLPSQVEDLGEAPFTARMVPAGSHVVVLHPEAAHEIRVPVLMRSGEELRVTIDLSHADELHEGEVLVVGGDALLGGEDDVLDGNNLREVFVPSFIIKEKPVTFDAYLAFVAEVLQTHPKLADSYLPRGNDGDPYFERTRAGTWEPVSIGLWADSLRTLMRLPVVGVDVWGAEAYATWLSRKTRRLYRLPTEREWEKAARGVDGRKYPWGDRFDASFCKMRDSRQGDPRPEPSGVFAADVSPYGVRDMAGGVADWVASGTNDGRDESKLRRVMTRGGAWCDSAMDCRIVSRRPYLAVERSSRVGFRLARSVGRSGPESLRPRPRSIIVG